MVGQLLAGDSVARQAFATLIFKNGPFGFLVEAAIDAALIVPGALKGALDTFHGHIESRKYKPLDTVHGQLVLGSRGKDIRWQGADKKGDQAYGVE